MEIKIRYTFKRIEDGHIWQSIWSLESIEKGSESFSTIMNNKLWRVIGKDLFTGLRRKNNYEIYENDIVKVGNKVMKVIFKKGCFITPYEISNYRVSGWDKDRFKVIGNIYENKELLK